MQEIRTYGIKIYQFPDAEDDEDETQANKKLKVVFSPCCYFKYRVFVFVRRESHLLLSVATQWWRLAVRKCEGVYTPGVLQKWIVWTIVTL